MITMTTARITPANNDQSVPSPTCFAFIGDSSLQTSHNIKPIIGVKNKLVRKPSHHQLLLLLSFELIDLTEQPQWTQICASSLIRLPHFVQYFAIFLQLKLISNIPFEHYELIPNGIDFRLEQPRYKREYATHCAHAD